MQINLCTWNYHNHRIQISEGLLTMWLLICTLPYLKAYLNWLQDKPLQGYWSLPGLAARYASTRLLAFTWIGCKIRLYKVIDLYLDWLQDTPLQGYWHLPGLAGRYASTRLLTFTWIGCKIRLYKVIDFYLDWQQDMPLQGQILTPTWIGCKICLYKVIDHVIPADPCYYCSTLDKKYIYIYIKLVYYVYNNVTTQNFQYIDTMRCSPQDLFCKYWLPQGNKFWKEMKK